MNSIVLMGEVATRPELRETQEGLARANFILRFNSPRAEEPDYQVQVVAFGNVASELNGQLVQGDQVIVEGRLQMSSSTRQDGNREKRAEVILRRIHPVSASETALPPPPVAIPIPPPPVATMPPARTTPTAAPRKQISLPPRPAPVSDPPQDDIPF